MNKRRFCLQKGGSQKHFVKIGPNHCGDIAIFVIFKMAATAILDFQKFEILTVNPL